ncbi:MAG TPA: hypothetical protein VEY05_05775 [Beijerinckiaceae bacterium]|nr:hypothetical protein [Beijerinckiaceae bacterium]
MWVGFPKGRIPMGNLFGGRPVDGGTFPAQIWGRYMKLAKRKYCGKFPKPNHAFKTKSFKGKFSSQALSNPGPVDSSIDPATGKPKAETQATPAKPPGGATPGQPPAAPPPPPPPATGGGNFDPDLYDPNATDQPPQDLDDTPRDTSPP